MASEATLSQRVEDLIVATLREEDPWMTLEAVHAAANACANAVTGITKEHETHINAAKARCSFISLSTELRNRIYDLSLRPQEDGEGGIKGCRAIYVSLQLDETMNDHAFCQQYATSWTKQPAITKLSREIRAETLPVYYGCNTFVINCSARRFSGPNQECIYDFYLGGAEKWLRCIGPANSALVKHLDMCHNMLVADFFDSISVAPRAFERDLTDRLYSHEITLPPIKHLALSDTGEQPYQYHWVPVDFHTDINELILRPILPVSDDSMAYRMALPD